MYTSTFVRFERRGDRLVPVRVTKSWVVGGPENAPVRSFMPTRVTEVAWGRLLDREQSPEAWVSSNRQDSRERLMTLLATDGEPALQEAGYDQRWLPCGDLSKLTWAQAQQRLDGEVAA